MIETWSKQIPDDLVAGFRANQPPVLFLGAGFGKTAIPPLKTGGDLCKELRELLHIDEINPGEGLPELTQYFKNSRMGNHRVVVEWLRQQLEDGTATYGGAHVLALQLPIHEILTTNYDSLLLDAAPTAKKRVQPIHTPSSYKSHIANQASDAISLGYLHGSFNSDNVVITTKDFIDIYATKEKSWTKTIEDALQTKRVVFIGYSLRDFTTWTTYISALLSDPGGNYPHTLVAPTKSPYLETFWSGLGIQYVPLKAHQFLIGLHERLGTLYNYKVAKAAVAACLNISIDKAEDVINAEHANTGYEDVLNTAIWIIRSKENK